MMPLRRVSSEKIAFLYSLITCNEEHQSSTLRRLTFIVPNVMKEISLHNLKGHFDDNLVNLYNKIPANAFYYVKSWINLDFDHKIQKDVSYDFDYTFYSPFVMDIEMTSIMYIFGKPIVVMQCTLSRTEATDGSSKYYIYQAKLPYDSGFIDELTRLKNKYGYKLVQKVLENQTRLIILTDQQTNDPIFALARKSEYVPNFTGYQFCRVV
uniref:YAP binding domain-containing protein n=1 Tax=Acrobeloides nanus TaxID=290746 RepID=A0A914DFM6_9BILA